MSLVSCVYCNTQISEHAVQCPKCGNSEPTNMNKKKLDEKVRYLENRKKQYLPFTISCEECNHNIELEDFSYVDHEKKCPTCGFPKNTIKCFTCPRPASDFDPETEHFYCFHHTIAVCTKCGKFIRGNDIEIERWHDSCSGGGRIAYYRKCYNIIKLSKNIPKKKGGFIKWLCIIIIIYIIYIIYSILHYLGKLLNN